MMPLPDKLHWPLFAPGDHVLVAVSGGPDSLSLLHALWSEREARGLTAVEAAHLNHGLRGSESAAEAAWVSAWCEERGIPCHVGLADVATLARGSKRSKQEAARAARYAFLATVAARIGATKIATGHTRDDQVETVLMNILRGTGLDGLRGIPARRGRFVRPLLDVSRAEIEDYCAAHGLEPRRDPSNLSADAYTRNRVRLELLPLLVRDYSPAVAGSLLRLSDIAGRDLDYLQTQADAALAEATRAHDVFRLVLDRAALAELHPALLRHVLRRGIVSLRGTGEGVTYEHVEWACRAVATPASRTFALSLPRPFCTVRVNNETVAFTLPNASASLADVTASLLIPGTAALPGTEWTVRASFEALPDAVVLDADAVSSEVLTLRNWHHGDQIDPLGMGGRHKKVSDIFTDAKVPHAARHRIPIVADAQGVLWIAGHCLADRAKLTPSTQRRLYLMAHVVGEAGNRAGGGE